MKKSKSFLLIVLLAAINPDRLTESAEVYVDWKTGNDELCSSLQDLAQNSSTETVPCKSINTALGNVSCSYSEYCDNENPLADSVVRLSNGVHTLLGCIAILQGENVTIEAENIGEATIKCNRFDNAEVMDNIQSCYTRGLTFRGINFEGCGPLSPNVFLNRSTGVLFEDCKFR